MTPEVKRWPMVSGGGVWKQGSAFRGNPAPSSRIPSRNADLPVDGAFAVVVQQRFQMSKPRVRLCQEFENPAGEPRTLAMVDGETPILLSDGEWRPLRVLAVGDQVVAFDEHTSPTRRRWRPATVLHKWTTETESLRLTFEDGRELVCSRHHRWLSCSGSPLRQRLRKAGGDGWGEAGDLRVGDDLAAMFAPQIIKHNSQDYMRGYIAGACLGDGSFNLTRTRRHARSRGVESRAPYWQIMVVEDDAEVLDRIEGYFEVFGLEGARRSRKEPNRTPQASSFAGTKPMAGLRTDRVANCQRLQALMDEVDSDEYRAGWLAGLFDTDGSLASRTGSLAFYQKDWGVLGRVQSYAKEFGFHFKFAAGACDSVRLSGDRLQRYRFALAIRPALDRKMENLDERTVRIFDPARVASVEHMGVRQMIGITTSTATFVANGILSSTYGLLRNLRSGPTPGDRTKDRS